MNLFMLIFLSIPEAILSLPFMLIISGKKEKLKFKIGNVIQFFISIALMLTASCIIRPLVSDVSQSTACHTLAYSVIVILVYRIHPAKALLGVAWTVLFVSTLENSFIPFVITYLCKGISNFYGSNITLLVCSIPVRICQVVAARYFYNNDEFLDTIRNDKKYSIIFGISSFFMVVAEVFISYTYAQYFDKFTFMIQLLFSCALLVLMLSFYVAIFGFIYIMLNNFVGSVKDCDEKQKEQSAIVLQKIEDRNHKTLEELYNILQRDKYKGEAVDLLKSHLDTEGEKN
jgi:hypothetical protein